MARSSLIELAEKVQSLAGPCAATDFDILCMIDPRAAKTGPLHSDPRYTASLDAAMTLARHDGEAFVALSDAMIALEDQGWSKGQWAKQLARYVTAAALRARATGGTNDTE